MRAVNKTISGCALAAALALGAAPASAATVFSAGWDPAGCSKASCFNDKGVYTHTWSATGVTGPVDVGQLLLDRGILGSLDSHIFRLSFQVGGQEVGSWGNYMMSGIGGDVLSFSGESFVWNPQDGDLVLVLQLDPRGRGGPGGVFSALASSLGGGGAGGGGPAFAPQNLPETQDGPTGDGPSLDARLLTGVPEPASWALMISGFGLAGAGLRRRRTAEA